MYTETDICIRNYIYRTVSNYIYNKIKFDIEYGRNILQGGIFYAYYFKVS